MTRALGAIVLAIVLIGALAAPALAPNSVAARFGDFLFAPPMRPHLVDDEGKWRMPFVYRLLLVNRLESSYLEDRDHPIPLQWFAHGKLVNVPASANMPLLLLGGDSAGRDVFGRLLYGARASLGLAALAAFGALLIGVAVGGIAGFSGGPVDETLMALTEFIVVLPAIYLILALRAAMPLVIESSTVFVLISGIMALVGWPFVARGVRAIVAGERRREYAVAAESLGAGRVRVLGRHLLPACKGFLAVQTTLLIPAFILAEATLSFVGLGFADPVSSWGTMLHDASNVSVFVDFPWMLSPAAAIFLVVLSINLIVQSTGALPVSAGLSGRQPR